MGETSACRKERGSPREISSEKTPQSRAWVATFERQDKESEVGAVEKLGVGVLPNN